MANGPKDSLARLLRATNAWETLRSAKSFGGMTLAQFKAKVQPCIDTRAALDGIEKRRTEAQDKRDEADDAALAVLKLVVNGVKGDPAETENGELYEAMGYVRASERSSGLTRKGKASEGKQAK